MAISCCEAGWCTFILCVFDSVCLRLFFQRGEVSCLCVRASSRRGRSCSFLSRDPNCGLGCFCASLYVEHVHIIQHVWPCGFVIFQWFVDLILFFMISIELFVCVTHVSSICKLDLLWHMR